MNFKDAWRETLAIYLLLLSDPTRVLRFAGAPALVLAVLGVAQMTRQGAEGGSLLLFLSVLGTIWGLGLWTVRWMRFLLLGEDKIQFWDMPFDRRMWRTGGLMISMLLLSGLASILPASLVMTLVAGVMGPVVDPGATDPAALTDALPNWFQLLTLAVIVAMMLWPVARFGPALGSVVQDGKLVLGASWKATARLGGLPPLMAMLLVNVPIQAPAVIMYLVGISQDSLILVILANILLSVTHPLVTATTALLWARIYGVAIGPYQPRIIVRDEE